MSVKPTDRERLKHIIQAIERIFKFTDELTIDQFYGNEMAQFAVIKNFEIIGEAAYQLPKEIMEKYEEVEWRKIMAFRHLLVHDYYKINIEIVWNAIENKLVELQSQIEEILSEK